MIRNLNIYGLILRLAREQIINCLLPRQINGPSHSELPAPNGSPRYHPEIPITSDIREQTWDLVHAKHLSLNSERRMCMLAVALVQNHRNAATYENIASEIMLP